MKSVVSNALGSWVTSVAGTVLGVPEMWAALQPVLDNDPATEFVTGQFVNGLALFLLGILARDGHKNSEAVGAGA